jgi:hypothetical protein
LSENVIVGDGNFRIFGGLFGGGGSVTAEEVLKPRNYLMEFFG